VASAMAKRREMRRRIGLKAVVAILMFAKFGFGGSWD
jgi:hypothetical protein